MSATITDIPDDLRSGPIRLLFVEVVAGNPELGLVPWYHFKIVNQNGVQVGHINFRVGDTRHVTKTAGHVGFAISSGYRGSSLSYHACLALAPFIRRHYDRVILTADPANGPSNRTIAKLGARFMDEFEVPPDDPAYANGARRKRRYEWMP